MSESVQGADNPGKQENKDKQNNKHVANYLPTFILLFFHVDIIRL
jgi:hypothetical protein